ncbi:hypothetical protein V6N13_089882 [Hibiscus sabdariffa]|uniref:BHLH domain-containing protein n=1 Tax=Hibiscus sabdariffa TaxID=183260 RepID=A0ABR2QIN3_9ROSI
MSSSSSPHLEHLFTVPVATDDLWPLIQGDKDAGDFSASIPINNHPWPSSQAIDKRIEELDSSKFFLEPVDPSIEDGLMENIFDYSIADSLSAPPEDSDDINLLLQESNNRQLPAMSEETRDVHVNDTAQAEPSNGGKGSITKRDGSKTRGRNYRIKQAHNGEEGTTMKKEEHNAKERIRRMKQHAAYLDLGALLPADSSISKKRTSAPLILDRAVEYIPELEQEIERLTLRKNDILSSVKHKQSAATNHLQLHRHPSSVSVHEIEQGEFIVQIFSQGHENGAFSNLLQNVEDEEQGMSIIMSASVLQVSDHGHCYNLHIKMKRMLDGENNTASLRDKVISWFC